MLLMHYFNRSHFELRNEIVDWTLLVWIFRVEIALIFINILHTVFFLWINLRSSQFHQNWTNIMSILYVQHITADVAWIGQRVLLSLDDFNDPFDSPVYVMFSYVRAGCLFMGLSILPILITERYFATLLLSDYECKPRGFISVLLIILLIIIGIASSVTYHAYNHSYVHFILVCLFSSLGILGNLLLLRINKRYYMQDSSLRARFQIAENIKVCQMVNMIVFSMGGFNGLICCSILLQNFDLSVTMRSLSVFVFDFSALMYSTIFPYVCMHYCNRWKAVFMRVVNKLCYRSRKIDPYVATESDGKRASVILKTTFGQVMTDFSTEAYFRQLHQSWDK